MSNRLDLHEMLCDILGSRSVYFQPPESVRLVYPAIVYKLSNIRNRFADNRVYIQGDSYAITVITTDPDSDIVRKISKLPQCRYDRDYISDNLYHTVFTLSY